MRATGRAVSADQCGVPLDRRFAFYDQIHTTGMDIKHVVNAIAVITLGKDMVFRDYVQGAYRMRGIGAGQRIHLYMIPEVHDLVLRELRAAGGACLEMAAACASGGGGVRMLEAVVSWLVINSMRAEQMQWSMLCIQNVANIYRKNAFRRILSAAGAFAEKVTDAPKQPAAPLPAPAADLVATLPLRRSLKVFDESIDFSLEASVPDPIPFEAKLREMLTAHDEFILTPEEHEAGHRLMTEVAAFSLVSESGNLDTEQEREQEQEQEKEVKSRRDQQVEVEKFVEREYRSAPARRAAIPRRRDACSREALCFPLHWLTSPCPAPGAQPAPGAAAAVARDDARPRRERRRRRRRAPLLPPERLQPAPALLPALSGAASALPQLLQPGVERPAPAQERDRCGGVGAVVGLGAPGPADRRGARGRGEAGRAAGGGGAAGPRAAGVPQGGRGRRPAARGPGPRPARAVRAGPR